MPDISLDLIDPNPFRDFELHPIDDVQVARLKASIDADGFWTSVVARLVGDRRQLAFGHHRIAAARAAGWTTVPIEVRQLTDWQMVRMLASENATQRGTTAAACLDAIAAVSRVVINQCWKGDATLVSKIFETSLTSAESTWGKVRRGEGPGESCILSMMPAGAFTLGQIRIALGVLKDSGRMAAIVADASGDAAAPAVPPQFDARCAHLFKLDAHLSMFRQVVTGETFLAYLGVEQQFDFAKSVLASLHESMPNKEVTARDIRAECWSRIETDLGMPKGRLRTAPERPYLEEIKDGLNMLRRAEGDFKRGVALLLRGFQLGEQLNAKQVERLNKMEATFAAGWDGMKQHRETIKRHLKLIGKE